MNSSIDPVELASRLIACPSITPASGEVFDLLEEALRPLGFEVHRWVMGEAPDGPTENMVAIRGEGAPHFGFAGHLDVVPPGDGWESDPFEPVIEDGVLTGRGANDMKSAIAAFVAAVASVPQDKGTLSLLITGDEEGYATYGTPRIIDWLNERGIRPDMILIGEPTSVDRLGDTIKIGRRGSVNMWIDVPGTQGHVAYPHRADNPVPKLARVIAALDAHHLDDGTDAFPPSNLEFTGVSTPTHASNVIPASATGAAQHPLQQPPARRRSGQAGRGNRRAGGPGRDRPGAHFGRSLPHPTRRTLRRGRVGDPRRNRASSPNCRPAAARRTAAS